MLENFRYVGALGGCGGLRNATELAAPAAAEPLSSYDAAKKDPALRDAAKSFAAKFAAEAVKDATDNIAVAPISVYFALGLAAECAAGETREELLSALGTDYATLKENYSDLYRSVIAEYETNTGSNSCRSVVGNSIWLQEGVTFKQECLETLSNSYLCWSYAADFQKDNRGANDAVRAFVKQQTHGIIDRDLKLSDETVFTIINTLYFKDLWNLTGSDLPYAEGDRTFRQQNGEEKSVRLLQGYYFDGKAYEGETFTHFFTETHRGYKLKFILPKEGYTASEVFTAENLALVNGIEDYCATDDTAMIAYETRCLFPVYRAGYDGDIKPILQKFGVQKFFSDACDLTGLTDEPVWCNEVKHITELDVNRKGIEGAAVTVIPGAGAAGPGEYTIVTQDFILDRAFGFLLTDELGTVLFSGIVNQV